MNKITKKISFGLVGIAGAGALAFGAAAPAMASTGSHEQDSPSWSTSYTRIASDLSSETPVVVAPEVGVGDVLGGGILNGGVANGNAVASGNEVTAPVASGNDTELTAPLASGNDTAVGNDSGNGTSVGSSVSDLVDVDGMVDGILDSVDLNSILQGR